MNSDFELQVTPNNAHLFKAGIVIASLSVFTFMLQSQDMDNWQRATMDIGLPDPIQNYIIVMSFIMGFGAWFWIAFKMVDSSAEKRRLEELEALLDSAENDRKEQLS